MGLWIGQFPHSPDVWRGLKGGARCQGWLAGVPQSAHWGFFSNVIGCCRMSCLRWLPGLLCHVLPCDVSCDVSCAVMWCLWCVMCCHVMCHVLSCDVSCDVLWCVMWYVMCCHVMCRAVMWCVMCAHNMYHRSGNFHFKIFSWFAQTTKIKNMKYILQRIFTIARTFLFTQFHSTAS